MRQDEPDANVTPGPVPGADPEHDEPDAPPSNAPDAPQTVTQTAPSGDPTPPSQADFENAQVENAESSLDEPSDNSGGE